MSKDTEDFLTYLLSEMSFGHSDLRNVIPWNYPLAITSGAIDQSGLHKDLFGLQANTSKGLWSLHAIPQNSVGEDELREFLEDRQKGHQSLPLRWNTRNPTIVIRSPSTSLPCSPKTELESQLVADEELLDDWRLSASELLKKLLDPSTLQDELFDAVLFAEITAFEPETSESTGQVGEC